VGEEEGQHPPPAKVLIKERNEVFIIALPTLVKDPDDILNRETGGGRSMLSSSISRSLPASPRITSHCLPQEVHQKGIIFISYEHMFRLFVLCIIALLMAVHIFRAGANQMPLNIQRGWI